ncbi:MAG: GNAT family N-acetyltransferase [Ruminococcus sp.]|nr:GNAT family N-acetyltransferase [Ruminococcus sp.]
MSDIYDNDVSITDRDITDEELRRIYDDFKSIEAADGVPESEIKRYQFILEEGGSVIGYVSGITEHRWFYLTDLWVESSHRRCGLGSKLLLKMEKKAEEIGMLHIYLWTAGRINPLFYEKNGYTAFTVLENKYEVEGYHQTGYRKDLGGKL